MASRKKIILITVLLLAAWLRLFRLGQSPISVNWDEAALGYNAYSLLKTGRDEYAKPLPVSLRSFDDYKPAVYSYLIVPLLTFSKLSDAVTRLPSAFMGTLLVFLIFYISYRLTSSWTMSSVAALLVAVSPWSVHFSRMAFEANVANTFLYLGLSLFLNSLSKPRTYFLSLIFIIISMYTYHSERAIAIPLLVILTFIFKKTFSLKIIPVAIILLLPLVINFFTDPITARFSSTSVFKLWPFTPKEFSHIIYTPLATFIWQITGQYLAYFSPANLFLKGSQEPNQYVPSLGLFHILELPFLLIGFLSLRKYKHLLKFLVPIFILAPLPGVITWNWFSVIRTLPLYPAFSIVIALGFTKLLQTFSKPVLLAGLLYAASVIYLANTEIIYSPAITHGESQPGFEQAVPYLFTLYPKYDHIIIDSPHVSPYIFLLFYSSYDPNRYQSYHHSSDFDKFQFRTINWNEDKFLKNTLFMGPTGRLPDYEFSSHTDHKILKDIPDFFGYTSFRIVE